MDAKPFSVIIHNGRGAMKSIVWNGKEVIHPVQRSLVIVWASTILTVVLVTMFITVPIWWPLNLVLKAYGRKGFIHYHEDGNFDLVFKKESFHRQES